MTRNILLNTAQRIDEIAKSLENQSYSDLWSALNAAKSENAADPENDILELIAGSCSMVLQSKNMQQPYSPYIQLGDKRSVLPEDYTCAQLNLLESLEQHITSIKIATRINDILWISKSPKSINNALKAINGYLIASQTDEWIDDGRQFYERGLYLALHLRSSAEHLFSSFIEYGEKWMESDSEEDRRRIYDLCRIYLEYLPKAEITKAFIDRCYEIGKAYSTNGDSIKSRHFLEIALIWHEKTKQYEKMIAAILIVASDFIAEADNKSTKVALLGCHLYEAALQHLRRIPRKFRAQHQINEKIREVEIALRECGEQSLHEMGQVSSDSIDISDIVRHSIQSVADKSPQDALLTFVNLHRSPNPDKLRTQVIELMSKFPLSHLFSNVQYASDGRIVAKTQGSGFTPESNDSHIFSEMIRNYLLEVGLAVSGQILPALDTIRNEHKFHESDFVTLVLHSPFFPKDRAATIGKGLFLGYTGEFIPSLYVLTPQFEHLIRFHLKTRNISTTNIDSTGIENENGMSSLLEIPEVANIFTPSIAFELKCVFTESTGPNLRNNCAHGLLSDAESQSASCIYAWWLMLKLVYNTFYAANFEASDHQG